MCANCQSAHVASYKRCRIFKEQLLKITINKARREVASILQNGFSLQKKNLQATPAKRSKHHQQQQQHSHNNNHISKNNLQRNRSNRLCNNRNLLQTRNSKSRMQILNKNANSSIRPLKTKRILASTLLNVNKLTNSSWLPTCQQWLSKMYS